MPAIADGAVLFADISGFTPLTNRLVQEFGPRRGVDELTRQLNMVYSTLIAEVERFGGSVIGFSGDAITCWFAEQWPPWEPLTVHAARATSRALASALAMQAVMRSFANMSLAIKTSVVAGPAHRLLVGDPAIQTIDVLAGATLDRMAACDLLAQKGELIIDETTARELGDQIVIAAWRTDPATHQRFAVVRSLRLPVSPVTETSAAAPLPEEVAKRWILPAIYERIQTDQSRFLAELRPASALFLRFTGINFDQDVAAASNLDAYIRWVQRIVNRYEGALIQLTTGDKGSYLFAAFGAPIAHDDDSLRAVTAALELRATPTEFPFLGPVQIGISYGMMRVGAYGSTSRRTYGVLGDETILAARLMSAAAPGQIIVSQSVATAVADDFELEQLSPLQIKGWEKPQPAAEVRAPRTQTVDQGASRFATPLFGRDNELRQLVVAAEQALQGQTTLIRIEGGAGVGKSHLAATFLQAVAEHGLLIASAACQSTSQDIAYRAGGQVLRALLKLSTTASEAQQIALVERAIQALNPAWLVRMPLLGDILSLPIPDNQTTAAFDPRLRQEALTSLVVDIVQMMARQQPILLFFEDIHWLDEASQGLVMELARMAAALPLLILLVHRPPVRGDERFLLDVAALPAQIHLALHELPAAGLAALIRHRLAGEVDPLVLDLVQVQTQGNPFFAEELVDTLVDEEHLQIENTTWVLAPALLEALRSAHCLVAHRGVWTLAHDAPLATVDLGIPTTVQGIVLARLDRLPEEAKLTLKVASVIGGIFEAALLEQVHPLHDAEFDLAPQMALLLRRDFAYVETPTPQLRYIFKHNIIQEVAYQSLLEDQRQELHLKVAQVLEQLHSERVEDLAFHFGRSDLQQRPVRDKTLHYLDASGRRAHREYANETALTYFKRALALEVRWPWLKAQVEILHTLGRRDQEQAALTTLQSAPSAPLFEVALLWGEYYEAISEYDQAQQALQQALDWARTMHDAKGEARALARLGMIAWSQGDFERAEEVYQRALNVLGNGDDFGDEEAEIRRGLGLVYRQQGKYDEAQAQFRSDLAINRALANLPGEARALNSLGHVAFYRRNLEAALSYYRQAQAIFEVVGDQAGLGSCLFSIGQSVRMAGDFAEAEQLLHKALQIHERINDRWWQISTWNELGILHLVVGNYHEAEQCLLRGLAFSREIGDESGEAYLLCNLGQVKRELGEGSEAEANLKTALHMAQEQRDLQLEAICYSDLALVSLYNGDAGQAIVRAQRSLALFRSLELSVSTTADLGTLATAHLALGNEKLAFDYAQEAFALLQECQGEGPDYPQRDYWVCHQVFAALGKDAVAQQALAEAQHTLTVQAERITQSDMRNAYLENVAHNRAILQATS